jgi:membrane-associated phospholipid phosphatase
MPAGERSDAAGVSAITGATSISAARTARAAHPERSRAAGWRCGSSGLASQLHTGWRGLVAVWPGSVALMTVKPNRAGVARRAPNGSSGFKALAITLVGALVCAAPPALAADDASELAPATSLSGTASVAPTPSEPANTGRYEFQSGLACPFCQITPQYPAGRSGLHWHDHWRAAGMREYVTIGALVGALAGVYLFLPSPNEPRWNEPILFDTPARDALRIHSSSGRRVAATISDTLFYWEVAHPTIIDPLLVAWWKHESPFVAWQMVVIDAQAYALTLLLTDVTKRLTARARPWVSNQDCASDPSGKECGTTGAYQSFNSGHSAVTATGAGLICAHHTQLNLYQNDALDVGTCALAVLGTALTGVMRIASDNHWASDVLVGHMIGYASGYLLPTALYYRQFRSQPEQPHTPAPAFAALPLVTDQGLGLALLGAF